MNIIYRDGELTIEDIDVFPEDLNKSIKDIAKAVKDFYTELHSESVAEVGGTQ